jgi:hypothetical protein
MVGNVEVRPVLAEGGGSGIAGRGEQASAEGALGDGSWAVMFPKSRSLERPIC